MNVDKRPPDFLTPPSRSNTLMLVSHRGVRQNSQAYDQNAWWKLLGTYTFLSPHDKSKKPFPYVFNTRAPASGLSTRFRAISSTPTMSSFRLVASQKAKSVAFSGEFEATSKVIRNPFPWSLPSSMTL